MLVFMLNHHHYKYIDNRLLCIITMMCLITVNRQSQKIRLILQFSIQNIFHLTGTISLYILLLSITDENKIFNRKPRSNNVQITYNK